MQSDLFKATHKSLHVQSVRGLLEKMVKSKERRASVEGSLATLLSLKHLSATVQGEKSS